MKKILILIVLIFFITTWGSADIFIKQKSHTAGYYYGGINNPAVDTETSIWFNEHQIAVLTEHRIIIIDKKSSKGYFINKSDNSFVQSILPMDLSKMVPDQLAKYLSTVQYHGSVKNTGEVKSIGKYKCSSYKVNSFIMYQGSNVNETDATIWVTTDSPVDAGQYASLNQNLSRLRNYSPQLLEEIKKIKGIPILIENYIYPKGFSVKTTVETVEIAEKQPPAGIYTVPEGCKQKEKLTMQDLRSR